jgi:transcriptional regulator with XRE-family HTH domain
VPKANTNRGVQEPEVIGEKVKRLRLQEGMSKAELARRAGLTRRTLSHIERNVTEPHMSTRLMLSEALGVPPGEFTEDCCSVRVTQKWRLPYEEERN